MATNLRLTLWGFLSSSIREKEIGAGKLPHVSLWGFSKFSSIEDKGLGAGEGTISPWICEKYGNV